MAEPARRPEDSPAIPPLVCPQCRAKYTPRRPTAGRRVRCRHCGHVWRDQSRTIGKLSSALSAAAAGWGQVGSTMLAAADHGSTIGRAVRDLAKAGRLIPGELVGRTLGRYEVRSVLGQGAMGYVYEAHDRDLQRIVALKVLPRRIEEGRESLGLKMFLQEARLAARLQHPNITTIYEIGQQDGLTFFAMERISGATLAALVEQNGPLPANQACYVIAHAARALHAGHESGVIHRDVKPSNIMIDAAGQVKVTDFGLAVAPELEGSVDVADRPMGTPGWIAPEVARGERATRASDIYSLGLTLHFALTRDRLVKASSKSGLIRAQREAKSIRREGLPAAWPARLRDIVVQCLQADPGSRYATADLFASDLLRALQPDRRDVTISLTDLVEPLKRVMPVSRRLALVLAGGAIVAALVIWKLLSSEN